jgi:hypothetical protein
MSFKISHAKHERTVCASQLAVCVQRAEQNAVQTTNDQSGNQITNLSMKLTSVENGFVNA